MHIVPEYDLGGMGVGSVVDRQTAEVRQHLSGREVLVQMLEHGLRRPDVILAVRLHQRPLVLRDRLVPRHAEFVVVDAELDLPLLQALLLLGEVVDIRVGQVVRLAEERVAVAAHDLHAQLVQHGVVEPHKPPRPQHVVVVLAVVEPHEIAVEQRHDRLPRRVDP